MKIGIVTIYGEFNYGNRLQNYALQKVLEKQGHKVETLVALKKENTIKKYVKLFLEKEHGKILWIPRCERKRKKNFQNFTKKYIKSRKFVTDTGYFPQIGKETYDCLVAGSDQIWNPLFWSVLPDSAEAYNYLLEFTSVPKFSYAASFGIPELPEQWEQVMMKEICLFDRISVREEAGLKILNKNGIQAEIVLDPTLLLTAEEWRRIENGSYPENKKYILIYMLGEQPDGIWKAIREKALEKHAEIIDLMSRKSPYYTKSPAAFVSLIDHAEMVFTDSFHACVFSLIFHTPFAVYARKHRNGSDMNGRIFTLLQMAGIKPQFSADQEMVIHEDFSKTDEYLEIEKKKSLDFLKHL